MSNRRIYPGRQWKDRLAMWAEEFPRHYMVPAEELKITGFFTKERLSMSQALERAGQEAKPVPAGTAWGNYWEYGWFFCGNDGSGKPCRETAGLRTRLR